ncbi:MAG: alpha/beta hydrolase [Desulfarculus sp.]|nr:MAG: alpha/beta hydrolase [Desulfarculus sp.]
MPILRREGVGLFYELAGSGGPPLVFIHGMTCDHSFFAPQVEYFAPRHQVLNLDLRGHGRSDRPQQDYRIPGFAADTAWLCQELGLGPAVVAGHSMGGAVALEMARRHPQRVRAAAVLDTTVLSSPERTEKLLPAMQRRMAQPDYREAFREYFGRFFLASDDAGLKARVLAAMLATPQHVIVSLFEALRQAACPLLYLAAANHLSEPTEMKKLRPELITGQVVGSGHFLTLQVPEQANAMLERFLALLGPA